MKKTSVLLAPLLVVLVLATMAMAETVSTGLILSPANEVPPIAGLNAQGGFQITVNVTRDAGGIITGGTVRFLGNAIFPGAVTVTGLHIHEGVATANGRVVINTGISSGSPVMLATGAGLFDYTVNVTDVALLGRLLKTPQGFYVNLHTTVNGGGAIRGQFIWFEERLSQTVNLTTAAEVPPVTNGLSGSGVATITASPTRDDKGAVTGGTVTFSMQYDLPAGSTLTGLHIHEGAPDVAGPVAIDAGLSSSNTVTLSTGKGLTNYVIPINATNLVSFRRMLENPAGFYVNIRTTANPGGLVRGQLSSLTDPPIIQQADTYFLETGSADMAVKMLATGIDLATTIVVNGQSVIPLPDLNTGMLIINIPAALRANAGVLFVQARNASGVMSTPIHIVVAPTTSLNTTAVTVVDAAKFGATITPESIAAVFGTKLASSTVLATSPLLPTSLDGTSVFVNGIQAPLFFVSPGQINFLIPRCPIPFPPPCPCPPPPPCLSCPPWPWKIVIFDKKGLVSIGSLKVSSNSPGIFTRMGNGLGAPAAVASRDGQNFNISLSNADGTPAAIDAGSFVSLFGTGMRYGTSDPMPPLMIGTTPVTLLFAGAQGQFDGLDQVNFQIPHSLAGKGEVDLSVVMPDGKTSNPVKLKIK